MSELSTYHLPAAMLSPLHILSHLTLGPVRLVCYYSDFPDEETEAQGGEVNFPSVTQPVNGRVRL